LYRLNDDNADVIKSTFDAFTALSTHVAAEDLVNHIDFIRNLINSMVSDARRRKGGVGDGEFLMPGFNIPKGKLHLFDLLTLNYMMIKLHTPDFLVWDRD
jgi:hypothetical protein